MVLRLVLTYRRWRNLLDPGQTGADLQLMQESLRIGTNSPSVETSADIPLMEKPLRSRSKLCGVETGADLPLMETPLISATKPYGVETGADLPLIKKPLKFGTTFYGVETGADLPLMEKPLRSTAKPYSHHGNKNHDFLAILPALTVLAEQKWFGVRADDYCNANV
jgi:hypothetical protein